MYSVDFCSHDLHSELCLCYLILHIISSQAWEQKKKSLSKWHGICGVFGMIEFPYLELHTYMPHLHWVWHGWNGLFWCGWNGLVCTTFTLANAELNWLLVFNKINDIHTHVNIINARTKAELWNEVLLLACCGSWSPCWWGFQKNLSSFVSESIVDRMLFFVYPAAVHLHSQIKQIKRTCNNGLLRQLA